MKNILLIAVVAIIGSLVSCKFAAAEIKKVIKIEKAAEKACDCKQVSVNTNYEPSENWVKMTVRRTNSEDKAATADSILLSVKDAFPKICNHDMVYIIFEGDEFDEQYTYYGCDLEAEVDTLYYETFEEEELDSIPATPTQDPNS